jgi:predicted  nucleic acid-binding Zn-ribbon protein
LRDELTALAKIAEIDASAREFDEELKSLPAKVEALKQDLATLEALLARERAQLEEATKIRAERAEELKAKNDALARSRSKTAHATNMKELDASEREVEAVRRIIREREEELASLEATIAQKNATLSEHGAQLDEARAICEEESKRAAERIKEVSSLREKVVAGRDELVARAPAAVVRRYERIRDRYKVGATFIDSEICRSCNRTFPTQLYVKIVRCEEPVECPFCHRLALHVSLRD